jgi:hypothetical protein
MKHVLNGSGYFFIYLCGDIASHRGSLLPGIGGPHLPTESRREVNGLLLQNVAILVPRSIQSGDIVIAK